MDQILSHVHQGHHQRLGHVTFTPGDPPTFDNPAHTHVFPHSEKRLSYQGFGAKNWQSRANHAAYLLPQKVDWTQGELVQEEIIWEAPQPTSVPLNANAAHTIVQP